MAADLVIVGGGIGGAVLAGLLARSGKKALVLERSSAPASWVRPEILWPRTMEVLLSLSPRERWAATAALPLRGIEFHDGRRVHRLFRESALGPGAPPWSTNPNETREHLLGLGTFEVRRGVEAVSVLKEGSRIVGVRTREVAGGREADVLGTLTVGDDGAKSLVREACGIPLATRRFPVEFVCFGSTRPVSVPPGCARVWWNPRGPQTGIAGLLATPLPGDRCAALVAVVAKTLDANPKVGADWDRFVRLDAGIADIVAGRRFPADMVRVHRAWGHAEVYGADGAVLMGDAAHPVSPAGGQGANMAIRDAVVLAELVSAGTGDLLGEYERRRRRPNAASLRPTRIADRLFSAPGWWSPMPLTPLAARVVAALPPLQRGIIRSLVR